eukprot:scaffold79342_cov29-Tisochrysis_lutea.AAC.4
MGGERRGRRSHVDVLTSWSAGAAAAACERFGSGGLGQPRWGVVTAGGWERGAVGPRAPSLKL